MAREQIDCAQCGDFAGWFYPARTYGDPDNCSPAEDTCEIVIDDNAFCSEECADEWEREHAEEDEEESEDEDA